jgi:hypothetical protein
MVHGEPRAFVTDVRHGETMLEARDRISDHVLRCYGDNYFIGALVVNASERVK